MMMSKPLGRRRQRKPPLPLRRYQQVRIQLRLLLDYTAVNILSLYLSGMPKAARSTGRARQQRGAVLALHVALWMDTHPDPQTPKTNRTVD